ncbi:DUF2303 family protein [uncultured Brevundimonas sp.]|uniref:DUF2303 family protein n=1 Tax=uncultured Brevundimonas sp. TaxID=213418 RepID=UPI0026028071|nr:DUF2303 family protein [uncultured Brevundimonas sp.]
MTDRTNADAVADLARRGVVTPAILKTESGRELLILPAEGGGASHYDVSEKGGQLAPAPLWVAQAVTIQTSASLIDYLDRFDGDGTVLFADIAHDRIVGALDYHDPAEAGRVAHTATLTLPKSVEWETWTAIDGQLMGQLEFARFLEENAVDIEAPDAADLLETCRDLQARRKVNFTKAVRTASDNETFEYTDETSAATTKGGVEIPTKFMLRIPVYFGGRTYAIGAFLRWRLEEGAGLLLGIKLHNREHVRQAVFKEVVDEVASATGRRAFFGRM